MKKQFTRTFVLNLAALILQSGRPLLAQQPPAEGPDAALSAALAAACRQDAAGFTKFLTVDNAAAFQGLLEPQRKAFLKRLVLLEYPGRALLSTSMNGRPVIRCENAGVSTEMRFGEIRSRDNLAFVQLQIPVPGAQPRTTAIGLVREDGSWKLLSVGLILLDIPSMTRQWEQADLEARETNAIAALRTLATALQTYNQAYGNLPETLSSLGPAPKGGISPEAAGLVSEDLASGKVDGFTIRYRVVPPGGQESSASEHAGSSFELAATPESYGKSGRRSFFLDGSGVLRSADKQGAVAQSTDPPESLK